MRLRPIVMTSLAIIAGMIPVAIGAGEGADFRAPLGRAVIGGVITSTLLTLLVIPTLYAALADGRDRVRERLRRRRRSHRLRHAVEGEEFPPARPLLDCAAVLARAVPVQRRNARLNALGSEKPRR